MRVLVVGDVHFCMYSSIVRKRGEYYSQRLENLLWSINWVERTAEEQHVDEIIYLGDWFDRADINSEEATAFREIVWAKNIPHEFLTGNHEISSRNLEFSSIHLIEALGDNFHVIDKPTVKVGYGYEFMYLPYIFECDRQPIRSYYEAEMQGCFVTQEVKRRYIFSHNDLKGVNYGAFESKEGFDLDEIMRSCSLFVNGHIHNGMWIKKDRILNLGNLTGQNFNEDGTRYPHQVLLLDTNTDERTLIENPYAFNFLKVEVASIEDLKALRLPPHSILSIKCPEGCLVEARTILDERAEVEDYRLISISQEQAEEEVSTIEFNSVDHLQQFQSYILSQLGSSDTVVKELQEVLK